MAGLVPRCRRVWAGRPVFFLLAPQLGMGQHAGSGAGVRARERERKNTETALVEVRGGHRTCSPTPPSSTILPIIPSETKNKNVEKSLYRSPVGNGVGMLALHGAHSLQINLQPMSMAQKQNPQRRHWAAALTPARA